MGWLQLGQIPTWIRELIRVFSCFKAPIRSRYTAFSCSIAMAWFCRDVCSAAEYFASFNWSYSVLIAAIWLRLMVNSSFWAWIVLSSVVTSIFCNSALTSRRSETILCFSSLIDVNRSLDSLRSCCAAMIFLLLATMTAAKSLRSCSIAVRSYLCWWGTIWFL